jgi:glutaconate CoA-transferase subunit B
VDRVDFVTSPGYLPGSRRHARALGGGPRLVVTDSGVYDFDDATGEMRLRSLHPGVTFEEAQAQTGWKLDAPLDAGPTSPPTVEELRILRTELDPQGHYLSR